MRNFVKIYTSVTVLTFSAFASAQDLPMPSPAATVKQRVGLTDIEVVYSRPSVKERKIFGDLVKYGEVWRTGANKACAITFSTNTGVAGQEIPAGTYAIFTIPSESEWTVIFSRNTEQWGAEKYNQSEDALRISVKPVKSEFTESMMFYFDNLRNESALLNLQWETTRISIPLTVNPAETAMKNIEKAIAGADDMFRTYNSSARYYIDNNLDAKKALEWAQKSVSMSKKYWNLTTLSRAQAANGMVKEAIKSAEEATALSLEAKNDTYVKQNKDNIAAWKAGK